VVFGSFFLVNLALAVLYLQFTKAPPPPPSAAASEAGAEAAGGSGVAGASIGSMRQGGGGSSNALAAANAGAGTKVGWTAAVRVAWRVSDSSVESDDEVLSKNSSSSSEDGIGLAQVASTAATGATGAQQQSAGSSSGTQALGSEGDGAATSGEVFVRRVVMGAGAPRGSGEQAWFWGGGGKG